MTTKHYLEKLIEYIKEKLNNSPFNGDGFNELFKGNSKDFDLATFYFLYKAITSKEKEDIQILIPDKYYKEELFNPLLISLSVIKYYQNLLVNPSVQTENKKIQEGDVFYLKSYNKLAQFVGKGGTAYRFTNIIQSKQERENPSIFEIPKEQIEGYQKFRNTKNFNYTSRTIKYLKEYEIFYQSTLKDDIDLLAKFSKKSIIIAPTSILNNDQKQFLPFRYNLGQNDTVPVEPLIEVFNSYEQARKHLKSGLIQGVEEVIFIGYQKYQDFGQIINDKNRQLFKKIIIIGSKKVNHQNVKCWQWTNSEIKLLKKEDHWKGAISPSIITSNQIVKLKKDLDNFKIELVELGIIDSEIESVNKYFVSLFSQQLENEHKEELFLYIETLFKEEDNDFDFALMNLDIALKEVYRGKYLQLIKKFIDNFESGKQKAIKNLKQIDKTFQIIISKREKEKVQKYLQVLGYYKHNVLTTRGLENLIANTKPKRPKKNVFIVPYVRFKYNNPLWFYHLYHKARKFGEVRLLCYSGFEEERLEMFKEFYRKQESYRLKHPDRNWFVDVIYQDNQVLDEEEKEVMEVVNSISVSDINQKEELKKVKLYFKKRYKLLDDENNEEEDKEATTESNRFNKFKLKPKLNSTLKFEIIFKDNTSREFGEYEQLAVQKNQKYCAKYTKELEVKDKIVVDWTIDLKTIFKILVAYPSFRKEVREINKAGKLWQNWLKGLLSLFSRKRTADSAAKVLYGRLNLTIQFPTFEKWLNTKDAFLFPRSNADLNNILLLKKQLSPNKEAIEKEIENFNKSSTSLLYSLKNELTIYLGQKEKGEILSKLKETDLKKLLAKKKINQINHIRKI